MTSQALLIYHAPHADRKLIVHNRWGQDYAADVPYSTRYSWEGDVKPGDKIQFVEVLLPHAPTQKVSDLAQKITVLKDELGIAVVSLHDGATDEIAVLNNSGKAITLEAGAGKSLSTDAQVLYLKLDAQANVTDVLMKEGAFVTMNGKDIVRQPKKGTVERVAG